MNIGTYTLSTCVFPIAVYGDLDVDGILAKEGYVLFPGTNFRFPVLDETYLTPSGKIATKQRGDIGPYGPRFILVEALTESERTYGKGIKTGEDALAKVTSITTLAYRLLLKVDDEVADCDARRRRVLSELRILEFRHLVDADKHKCCYITPSFEVYGVLDRHGLPGAHAGGKPVYIVERKLPRKKKVLILDFDEVQDATKNHLDQSAIAGDVQNIKVGGGLAGASRWIKGVVEEREIAIDQGNAQ